MPDFRLPDLGEGVTEAEIDRWLVKEGQEVAEDELLVEVITDKATAEIPSPYGGVVSRLHVKEGEVVPVGTVLITIGEAESEQRGGEAETPSASAVERPASPVRTGDGRVKAMPPVRKLARELGVDLMTVTGSGPGGRITREDVEAAAAPARRKPEWAADALPATPAERREPLRGVRRMIADHMVNAHHSIPPVTHVEECDVTELDATRRIANERRSHGPKLTYLPFIIKAVVVALKDHPQLNSSLDDAAGEIVYHDHYDIGFAVDAPQGLLVPVIRAANEKSVWDLAAEIERLAGTARAGALQMEDLRGSTFTVTNPGPFGGVMATPIINHPNAAILGVHRATDRPVVRDGQIVVRKMMNLSITFDHRLLDGVTAAKFCMDVVKLLEHPAVLALEA
jgi:pyruvate/2-oxoglutarate dehydrogenase complex dihydrolipoamide acyltransferase (E2) component